LNAFLKEGGEYRQVPGTPGPIAANRLQGISVTPGEILNADYYVFACGPWLGKVFPFLAPIITPTRQEVFFGTAAGDQRFTGAQIPVWIDNGKHRFYGIPGNHWRGFKIAGHSHGPVIDPTTLERRTSAEGLAAARAYLRLRFPELAGAPLVETRLCQYENTTDKNLILDHHPEAGNVWIVGGGSGHGFKHGPALGEIVSDAVLALKAPHGELGLGRLLRKMSS
jgi:sarcosine oxidase